MTPRLTNELGRLAGTLLLNLVNGQKINNVLLEPELVVRESTGKAK